MKPIILNAAQYEKKAKKMILLTVTWLFLCAACLAGIYINTKWYLKKHASLKSQKLAFEQATIANDRLRTLASGELDKLEAINEIFPDSDTIIDCIQTIESTLAQYDPNASVRIPNPNPVKNGTQLIIPLALKFRTAVDQTLRLFQNLERLPYVIEITSVDIKTNQGATSAAELAVNANVYVQDPFTK